MWYDPSWSSFFHNKNRYFVISSFKFKENLLLQISIFFVTILIILWRFAPTTTWLPKEMYCFHPCKNQHVSCGHDLPLDMICSLVYQIFEFLFICYIVNNVIISWHSWESSKEPPAPGVVPERRSVEVIQYDIFVRRWCGPAGFPYLPSRVCTQPPGRL